MILEKYSNRFSDYDSHSFMTQKKLLNLLEKQEDFKVKLIDLFQIDETKIDVIKIGNSKYLVDAISNLDSQCEKLDIDTKIRNVQLEKMLEDEKSIFKIFGITDDFIISKNRSDLLEVETAYSSKSDLLDYYNLSKFANYCRDLEYNDLIDSIKDYLKQKNFENEDEKSLRLLYKNDESKFFLRAVTSTNSYKDFGVNFSVFVALVALSQFVEQTKSEIFIDNYSVDDSTLYVSFSLPNETQITKNVSLAFNLLLENDEIKRNAVSFNGIFKLKYKDGSKSSEIFLKPRGLKKDGVSYPVDLLTYKHSGNVAKVFEKIQSLPDLIDFFIKQVADDAKRISDIKNPDDVRKHLATKIKNSKKPEFKKYKNQVFNKLMKMTANNTFVLFEIFRSVEELFEHEDVISIDFWREKLYQVLVERE